MCRFCLIALFAIVAIIAIGSSVAASPNSQTVDYTFEYIATNFYSNSGLTYEFSGLDNTRPYAWGAYTVNPNNGALDQYLGFRALSFVASGSVLFNSQMWPENYVGPIAIRDLSGTTIGRHFIAPNPSDQTSDWFSSSGNTALNEKQVTGTVNVFGSCRNPAYTDLDVNGWQHPPAPCSSLTISGNYALMHFQIDPAYVGPSDEKITFYLIPGSTEVLQIDIDDIVSFQVTSGYSSGWTAQASYAFLVINTAGNQLPFIDNIRAAASFTTNDNPAISEIEPGVYNCRRDDTSGPTWISDCESTWVVSNDSEGNEWTISAQDVSENGTQVLTLNQSTRAVWDSYHGTYTILDAANAFLDNTVYSFATARNVSYPIAAIPQTDVAVVWATAPTSINSGLATPIQMTFIASDTYDIIDVVTYEELIDQILDRYGLDNDLGRNVIFTVIMALGMAMPAIFGFLRSSLIPYAMIWTALGGLLLLAGLTTELTQILWGLMTLVLWVVAIPGVRGGSESEV